ncbi:hypothetical protein J6590_067183 [Homalodisca vitripennis]|nr:hypothetical protein J6590_067183 [Homalodisca vitripennis]
MKRFDTLSNTVVTGLSVYDWFVTQDHDTRYCRPDLVYNKVGAICIELTLGVFAPEPVEDEVGLDSRLDSLSPNRAVQGQKRFLFHFVGKVRLSILRAVRQYRFLEKLPLDHDHETRQADQRDADKLPGSSGYDF